MTRESLDVCLTRGLYYHAAVTKGRRRMSHGIKGDTRRVMGWVTLAGGMFVLKQPRWAFTWAFSWHKAHRLCYWQAAS